MDRGQELRVPRKCKPIGIALRFAAEILDRLSCCHVPKAEEAIAASRRKYLVVRGQARATNPLGTSLKLPDLLTGDRVQEPNFVAFPVTTDYSLAIPRKGER